MNKLKIAFITHEDKIDLNKKDLIEFINNHKNFDKSICIKIKNKEKKKLITSYLNNSLIKLIDFIEVRRTRKNKSFLNYDKKVNLHNLNLKIFNNSDLIELKNQNIDFLVFLDHNQINKDLVKVSKSGALIIKKSDDRFIESDVVGFWETYLNKPSIGFSINQILPNNESEDVLFRGNFRTRSLWGENKAIIDKKSIHFLRNTLLKFSEGKTINNLKEEKLNQKNFKKKPSQLNLIKYIFKEYTKILKSRFNEYIGVKKKWSVSFVNESKINIDFKKLITIKNPPNRFLADPFVIKKNGRNICFVEDYCFEKKRAKISAYELFKNDYKKIGTALEENFHLSFPFVFKHDQEIFMIPETGEVNEIRLYKCISFPLEWKFEKTLIKNIDAVDTIVFKKENKWCLLSNVCSSFINEHDSELHLYTSENLLSNNWVKSENNPIIFDSEKGRNGGFFTLENSHYRVNQVNKKNQYGYSLKINKILSINDSIYEEKEVNEFKPIFLNSLIGTHHFQMNEEFSVIDHLSISRN